MTDTAITLALAVVAVVTTYRLLPRRNRRTQ